MIEIITNFLTDIVKDPSAKEIFIRVVCVCYISMGLRNCIRWIKYLVHIKFLGKKITDDLRNKINDEVKGYLIPSSVVMSIFASWVYRNEFLPTGYIYQNNIRLNTYDLVQLEWGNIIGEGILYGFGSVAFLFTLKALSGFWIALDTKYKINFLKKR